MISGNRLTKIWDKESRSYRFDSDKQADYLANFYHITRLLKNIKNKKILEVGSGSGQMSAFLGSKGGIIHLVDISKKSLDFSRKYFVSRKIPVTLYQQNAFSMRFPKNSFDIVWSGGVIEHFSDNEKVKMIEKMWKLVKPGGKLLITVPNAYDLPFMIAKKILQIRKKWAFGNEDDMTIKRMKNLAKLAGINKFSIYAYNPIVGYWFFPYGRELTDKLHLNTLKRHKGITNFGHVIIFTAIK